jgi:phosphoribosylformylglycinamidine synthase subunit PurSL
LIVTESIRATSYYVNPMGIPMMHPVYRIHPGYAKCFALGHSIGLIPAKDALKDSPQPGDIALLIGGETGRDGIHGATASSTGMTGATLEKEFAAVQIGHPITERRFTSAIPVLRDAGCIRAITDLGAGGISSAAGEIGAESGVELDLDRVRLKDASLTAWEIFLSESQERMLLVVPLDMLDEAREILDRYEVAHVEFGRFTGNQRLQAAWQEEQVVDLDMEFLWKGCPIEPTPVVEHERSLEPLSIPEPKTQADWQKAAKGVISHYHCCDQSAAGVRFDTTVQGRTAIGPYGGCNHRMPTNLYVSAPIRGKPYGMVSTMAFNPFYGDVDPAAMAGLMLIEAVTKAVVAGASYKEAVLCDNFYTPRVTPQTAWELSRMVGAIADLSVETGIPFISGKDSSSGTFESAGQKIDVPMTLAVALMGRVPDVKKIVTKEFKLAGNKLVLVGPTGAGGLCGSVYADLHAQRGDRLFDPGTAAEVCAVWDAVLALHAKGRYVSGSAVAEGGSLLRLFEAAFGSALGARIDLKAESDTRADELLFGEFIGAVLLEVSPEVEKALSTLSVPHQTIGEVIAEPQLVVGEGANTLWQQGIPELAAAWSKPFREVME